MENKPLIKFPLINKWTCIITLIFILMRISNIIDWSPLWILSPLWIPTVIALIIIFVLYFLKISVWLICKLLYNR